MPSASAFASGGGGPGAGGRAAGPVQAPRGRRDLAAGRVHLARGSVKKGVPRKTSLAGKGRGGCIADPGGIPDPAEEPGLRGTGGVHGRGPAERGAGGGQR